MKFCDLSIPSYKQQPLIVVTLFIAIVAGCVRGQHDSVYQIFGSAFHSNTTVEMISIDRITSAERQWHNGDIIYVASGNIDHMAMIINSDYLTDNTPGVLDTDRNGTFRRHNDFDKWADYGGWDQLQGYYVSKVEQVALEARGESAKTFNIGNVYNAQAELKLVPNLYKRNSPSNTHSSQLVRHTYKYLDDLDLDTGGDWWSFPKEIIENHNVKAIPGALFART
mgnify:CR=1 FL=1